MRRFVGLCLVALLLGGCGGSEDRPDLEASPSTTEAIAPRPAPAPQPVGGGGATSTPSTGRSAPDPAVIALRAADVQSAIGRWDDQLAACLGPTGKGDDAGASCTHAAWEQLFDQMEVAQYYLLRLTRPLRSGRCHQSLSSALDAVHGFLAGAVPTNVVWLDEQQRPPSRFDLEAIVDVVRPVPGRMRNAAATACRS